MSSRILFLDIDGVLHPTSCRSEDRFNRLPDLAKCLSKARSPLEIVISSSWRFHHAHREIFRRFPSEIRALIVGVTGPPFIGKYSRYEEIQAYLLQRGHDFLWAALDDCAWEFPPECPELILCDGATGVTQKELSRLRAWISND
jgi:hypothetical protein